MNYRLATFRFKVILLHTALRLIVVYGYSQDTIATDYHRFYKELSLVLAYDYSFAEPNDKNFHLLETRIQKQQYGGRHPSLVNLNTGFIVGLNSGSFLISPVLGGVIGYGGVILGIDLAYFTDFSQGTLRLIPSLGFGFEQIRITLNPHIRITNRNYEPINRGHINLTLKILRLKGKVNN